MAAAIPFITTGAKVLGAVSSVAGAFSSRSQAEAGADASEYNAANARQNALLARRAGSVEGLQLRRAGAHILADQQSGFAASGVTQSGTPADLRASTMIAIETDALTAEYNAELKALGHDRTAALDLDAAKNSRKAGNFNFASGLIGAVPGVIDAGKSIIGLFR